MKTWEITWIRRGQDPTEGEFIPQPDYCRHSTYVSGMVVREIVDEFKEHGRNIANQQLQERCPHCSQPLSEEQMHGHYVCMNCKQVTVGCCDGNK